jgi:hypothetical protein
MIIVRILLNGGIMLAELAAIAAIAWLGYKHPFLFAGFTALFSFLLGLGMEGARLRNELPFYFENRPMRRLLLVPLVGFTEALFKAVLAGVAALFTFSGTDSERLMWVAIVFGVTVFAGSATLRALSLQLNAHPARWGYFRLGPALGLLFSVGLAALSALSILKATSLSDIGWKIIWELPPKPTLEQVSELFFQLKQAFDNFVVALLSTVLNANLAQAAGVVVSVNVLTGFVAAVYAAILATFVRQAEQKLP